VTSMPQTQTAPNLAMATSSPVVVGGVDTHKDLHVAAVIDTREKVLGTRSFSTTRAGYRAVIRWLRSFGDVRRVGVEGTGSYGAGLTRHLVDAGIEVLEVDRPDRSERRRKGKDDDLDAISTPLARPYATAIPAPQRAKTAPWSPCGYCGSPAPPRSAPVATPYSCCA